MQTTATELGVTLALFEAVDDDDLRRAVAAARRAAGALIVAGDAYFFVRHEQIVALAERHALPAMYPSASSSLQVAWRATGPISPMRTTKSASTPGRFSRAATQATCRWFSNRTSSNWS